MGLRKNFREIFEKLFVELAIKSENMGIKGLISGAEGAANKF